MKFAVLPAIVLLAACSSAPKAAPPAAVTLTPVLVVSGPRIANLEVRIASEHDLGQAQLSVSAPGVVIQPQAPVEFALQPPASPPPVHDTPYPLPPVILKVFRLEATGPGPHALEVLLTWPGGELKQEVRWNDDTMGQQP